MHGNVVNVFIYFIINVEGLEKARKNVGADKCWDGYKAKGTKKKGGKEVPNCVKEEDKAFNFVVNKLKSKYGDGVLTKGDKMPELSAAQKKKNAEIRAKRAKEDAGAKEDSMEETMPKVFKELKNVFVESGFINNITRVHTRRLCESMIVIYTMN